MPKINFDIEKMKKSAGEFDTRSIVSTTEIRMVGAEGDEANHKPQITGYALMFEQRSTGLPWIEIIKRSALDDCDMSQCKCLFNHEETIILGSRSGNTLELTVDERGLHYSTTPPDTQFIREQVLEPMRRGDIDKSSFRFQMDWEDEDSEYWYYDDASDMVIREIRKIKSINDVSPVTFPAYNSSSSSLRSAEKFAKLDLEQGKADFAARSAFLMNSY